MSSEIDLLEFGRLTGDLRWLSLTAGVFLRQLPQWRSDLAAAVSVQDVGLQLDLLHKMKGSCYAVAAYKIGENINSAELAHAAGTPLPLSLLLRHLERVETELRAILANAPTK